MKEKELQLKLGRRKKERKKETTIKKKKINEGKELK